MWNWRWFGKMHKDVNGRSPEDRRAQLIMRVRLVTALALPVFLETLDYTVVATAQAHIASAFNRLDLQNYIGSVYLLTSTVFLPLFASLSDVYGRHIALQISLMFFLVGSALSTAAQNMPMMLAGRGIAGVGAAGLLTVVRVILADSSSLDDNNFSQSAFFILYTIGFCTGPLIGGALVDVSFRWVFAINLPCCVVSMALALILLRKYAKGPQTSNCANSPTNVFAKLLRIDWIATTLFCGGGILLILGLNWGSNEKWNSTKVIVSLVVGMALLLLTLGWEFILENRQEEAAWTRSSGLGLVKGDGNSIDGTGRPLSRLFYADALIPLRVLSSYDILATSFAAFTSGMVMLVVFYFVAVFSVIVTGKSAVNAGVQLLYFAPGMGIGSVTAITMIKRLRQPKYPIIVGGILIPIGIGLISEAIKNNNQGQVNGYMILAGVGVGMTFGPISIHARFSQPQDRVAVVVGINLFFRSLGGTVGLAQCGAVLNSKVRSVLENSSGGVLSSLSISTLSSLSQIASLSHDAQDVIKGAFRTGLHWAFISLLPWACLSVIGSLFLSKIVESGSKKVMDPEESSYEDSKRAGSKDDGGPTTPTMSVPPRTNVHDHAGPGHETIEMVGRGSGV